MDDVARAQIINTYETKLKQFDNTIVKLLKLLLQGRSNSIRATLYTFEKFQDMCHQNEIGYCLAEEKKQFCLKFSQLFLEFRESLTNTQLLQDNTSLLVEEIKWLQMVNKELTEADKALEKISSDKSVYHPLAKSLKEFLEETNALIKINLKKWTEITLHDISTKEAL